MTGSAQFNPTQFNPTLYVDSQMVAVDDFAVLPTVIQEEISTIEQSWESDILNVALNRRNLYRTEVQSLVKQLRSRAQAMLGKSSLFDIRLEMQRMKGDLGSCLAKFYAANAAFERGKVEELSSHQTFDTELENAGLSSTDFSSVLNDIPPFDPFMNIYREETLGAIGSFHVAAKAVELVATGVAKTAEIVLCSDPLGIQSEAKRENCKRTLALAKKGIDKTVTYLGCKEFIKEGIEAVGSAKKSVGTFVAQELVKMGVQREEASVLGHEFSSDVLSVGSAVALPLAIKPVVAGVRCAVNTGRKVTKILIESAPSSHVVFSAFNGSVLQGMQEYFAHTTPSYAYVTASDRVALWSVEEGPRFFLQESSRRGVRKEVEDFISYQMRGEESSKKIYQLQKDGVSKEVLKGSSSELGFSLEKLAERVNKVAERRIYFPTLEELNDWGIHRLHQQWMANQETFVGILGTEVYPRIGFHGTSFNGMRGIVSSRTCRSADGEHLYVASYHNRVNPVAQLADIYSSVYKASLYMGEEHPPGVMFVIDATTAKPYGKAFAFETTRVSADGAVDERIFRLMQRHGGQPMLAVGKGRQALIAEDALVNVDEFLIQFNPENYDDVVKGFFMRADSLYNVTDAGKVFNRLNDDLFEMINRFARQEIVLSAFDKLKVLNPVQAPWEKYQQIGSKILQAPQEQMLVPFKNIGQVGSYFSESEPTAAQIFSRQHSYNLRSSSSFESIPRRQILRQEIGLPEAVSFHCYVEADHHVMYLSLEKLQSSNGSLNPEQMMHQIVRFAQEKGASSLYMEVSPYPYRRIPEAGKVLNEVLHVDREFINWIQRFPVIQERSQIIDVWLRHGFNPIFEIPIGNIRAPSGLF